ncbi:MAG: tRNA preQ1(34) S-adenosylmethionine ribosyltransferase-isomerase QueA [Bryobacteraceae bacterium]
MQSLADFDFTLPPELIAQQPLTDRAASRMLVVDRAAGTWSHQQFRDFTSHLHPGDCVVLNESRVFPARLIGRRPGFEGRVEVFLVRPVASVADGLTWLCLVHPGRKVRTGDTVEFDGGLSATVLGRDGHGERTLRFTAAGGFWETVETIGHVPLPPYIRRDDAASDRERYQTVFARERGSVAAPTAGLHFTPEILAACPSTARVTLHVGLGTFQPLRSQNLDEVALHSETYSISDESAAAMRAARRLVAVGTTVVRTLETAGTIPGSGETSLFIRPGFDFRHTGAMLTNFHLPKSSLFVLVCAFGGTELMKEAYAAAVADGYRFFSYGDCMLIV